MDNKKVALVTGGSRGIGKAICIRLAKMGFNVVFNYNSKAVEAEKTVALCKDQGVEAVAVQANVSKAGDCSELVQKCMDSFGRIDVLVNNAGITRDNLIMRMSDEDFDAVVDVNLKGTFYMLRDVSKIMLKQKYGHIINISSVVGVMGNAGQVNYAATKAGVIGMTKSLARELASRKITVNAIAPGMIATDMTAAMTDAAKEKVQSSIPFGQMGSDEDIANAVAFFAGNESGYITGQVLCVDGGMAI